MTTTARFLRLLPSAALYLWLGLAAPVLNAAPASTGSIAGTLQGTTRADAGGITVTILETGALSTTDGYGHFEFDAVAPGTYTLIASKPNTARLEITQVIVKGDRSLTLAAEVMPSGQGGELKVVSASEDIMSMVPFEVTDQKSTPYSDRNIDIPRTIDDPQPYYIYSSQQIEQSGSVNVEDFLKNEVTMDTNAQDNSQKYRINYGTTSTVNLRGLGANQTLILIDGRRSANVNFTGTVMQPSLNGVPLDAIDRIEVLPSAASAIYGSSAAGGVVNVVLKKDYNGGEIKYTYDSPFDTDAANRTLEMNYGFSLEGGKTHVMIAATYSDQHSLVNGDRPQIVQKAFAQILRNEPSFFYSAGTPYNGGTTNITSTTAANLTLKNGTALNSPYTYIAPGTLPGADLSSQLLANAGKQNTALANDDGQYGLRNSIGVAPFDKSILATVRRNFTDWLEVFAEFSTASDVGWSTYNVLARANTTLLVPATAPANPFTTAVDVNIPTQSNGTFFSDEVTQSVSTGFRLQLPGDWKAEVDYTWSQSLLGYNFDTYDATALTTDLASGAVNPFYDTLKTPLDLSKYYVAVPTGTRAELNDLGARASGSLFALPWGSPTLTALVEHRKEGNGNSNQWEYYPLTPASTFHSYYFGQDETTDSAAGELNLPLITAKNALPLVHSLDLDAAGRFDRYSIHTGTAYYEMFPNAPAKSVYSGPLVQSVTTHNSANPTVGLRYFPIPDVILRASYSQAYVPPTYSQLLPSLNPNTSLINVADPKTGTSYNVQQYTGGNAAVTPQTGSDVDLGAIYEPKTGALQGLRLGLEYFKFSEQNVISTLTSQQIVGFENLFPNRVVRDPATGKITSVDATAINLARSVNDGFEATAEYGKRTPWGTVHVFAMATVIEHDRNQITANSPDLEYVGYVADGGVAKTKITGRLTWEYRDLTLGWNTTFVDGYKQFGSPGDPYYNGSTTATPYTFYTAAQGSNTIPSQTYHTVFATYAFSHGLAHWPRPLAEALSGVEVTLGIKDVFNTVPPVDVYYTPYFYSPYGNPELREFWLSVKKKF